MLRIANYVANPEECVGAGQGPDGKTEGVYLDAGSCPTTPFIPCTAPQLKTFHADCASNGLRLITVNTNFQANPRFISNTGPGLTRGSEGVYMRASACPSMQFVLTTAAQLRTIRTAVTAWRLEQTGSTPAAPIAQTRKTAAHKVAGGGGGASSAGAS